MNHQFDVEHAKKYGVDAAIIINNIAFWVGKNKANGKHCHEGRTWTYNSARAFGLLFPYWSEQKIKRILLDLEKEGVLVAGNFNESAYDRTKWYAFKNEQAFVQIEPPHRTEMTNGVYKIDRPIPDINPAIKPVKKLDMENPPDGVSLQTWEDFKALRKAKRAPINETALNGIRREAEKAGISLQTALETCCERGWQGFKAEWYAKEKPAAPAAPHNPFAQSPEDRALYERKRRELGLN